MKRQLKLTVALLVITLLLGVACEYGGYYIAHTFQEDLLSVAISLSDKDWGSALNRTQSIHEAWQQKSRIVQLWINHTDIDDVTAGLIDLRSALLSQDFSAALSACGQCVENFGHLHHRDAFTLRNIL
ncbi:MAG: DUF4363 family protein [Clostridia bacterium]|nr:DUF4363 family protein [Clostridia bacterium]